MLGALSTALVMSLALVPGVTPAPEAGVRAERAPRRCHVCGSSALERAAYCRVCLSLLHPLQSLECGGKRLVFDWEPADPGPLAYRLGGVRTDGGSPRDAKAFGFTYGRNGLEGARIRLGPPGAEQTESALVEGLRYANAGGASGIATAGGPAGLDSADGFRGLSFNGGFDPYTWSELVVWRLEYDREGRVVRAVGSAPEGDPDDTIRVAYGAEGLITSITSLHAGKAVATRVLSYGPLGIVAEAVLTPRDAYENRYTWQDGVLSEVRFKDLESGKSGRAVFAVPGALPGTAVAGTPDDVTGPGLARGPEGPAGGASGATPSPIASAHPTATPVRTPRLAPTPTATPTPRPTRTPRPTPTPTATPTPRPTRTPRPTPTPTPSASAAVPTAETPPPVPPVSSPPVPPVTERPLEGTPAAERVFPAPEDAPASEPTGGATPLPSGLMRLPTPESTPTLGVTPLPAGRPVGPVVTPRPDSAATPMPARSATPRPIAPPRPTGTPMGRLAPTGGASGAVAQPAKSTRKTEDGKGAKGTPIPAGSRGPSPLRATPGFLPAVVVKLPPSSLPEEAAPAAAAQGSVEGSAGVTAPRPESAGASTPSGPVPTPGGQAGGGPAPGTRLSGEVLERQVASLIEAWKEAWSRKDLAAYMAFYSPRFASEGQDRTALEAHKRRVFDAAGDIDVRISGLHVSQAGERVLATFEQTYSSARHRDQGEKTLMLLREGGAYRIVKESFQPSRR